eukprot:TRINITY_DN2668_c0_g2_i1.p1 TRINITY_DN2668_c0_g2~~TRINITY_DN2668_c0_g2_i1.p1  ORF type:complete len:405 (+),score=92.00 TRINITY_DN2668_c0_g2_i1:130-1344(+)
MSGVVEVKEFMRYMSPIVQEEHHDFPYHFASRMGPEFDKEGTTMAWIASPHLALVYSLSGGPHSAFIKCPRILKSPERMACLRLGKCSHFSMPWSPASDPGRGYLLLATGLRNGCIKIYNALNCVLLTNLLSHTQVVSDLVFHPVKPGGYTQIVSVSMDRTIKVWDQEDQSYNMSESISTSDPLLTVAWSPNGQYVASAGTGRVVHIHSGFDTHQISLNHRLKGHLEDIVSLQFSSDSALLFSASHDTRIHVWDAEDGVLLQTLCHTYPVPLLVFSNHITSMCLNSSGTLAASVCNVDEFDHRIRLWEMEAFVDGPGTSISSYIPVTSSSKRALSLSITRNNNILAVLNEDRSVSLFTLITASPPSLKHLSRLCIRSSVPTKARLPELDIPKALLKYLQYEVWK